MIKRKNVNTIQLTDKNQNILYLSYKDGVLVEKNKVI